MSKTDRKVMVLGDPSRIWTVLQPGFISKKLSLDIKSESGESISPAASKKEYTEPGIVPSVRYPPPQSVHLPFKGNVFIKKPPERIDICIILW